MKVIDPGHKYELITLDGSEPTILTFVKRNNPPEKYPGNVDAYPGTTTQETIRAEIDRTKYVQGQQQYPQNEVVLWALRIALYELEARAAQTHGRFLTVKLDCIEDYPICPICGHVEPEKHHHTAECGHTDLSKEQITRTAAEVVRMFSDTPLGSPVRQ